jgi:hypothetical protein
VGREELFEVNAPNHQFSFFFEDDGKAGYVHAIDPKTRSNGSPQAKLVDYDLRSRTVMLGWDRCAHAHRLKLRSGRNNMGLG